MSMRNSANSLLMLSNNVFARRVKTSDGFSDIFMSVKTSRQPPDRDVPFPPKRELANRRFEIFQHNRHQALLSQMAHR